MSKALKILSRPKGNAEEYGRWAVNPYKGCSHGCLYCYLKKGVWANGLGGNTAQLKTDVVSDEHAYHLAMSEIIEHREEIIRDGGLFMTFTSDPCVEETRELFFHLTASAIEHGIPVTMLTKNASFFQYGTLQAMLDDAHNLAALTDEESKRIAHDGFMFTTWLGDLRVELVKKRVAFGWTLTGHDELEPNASPNMERIATMKRMNDGGYYTWASIEPVIDFPSALDMVYQAVNAGCQHFKIGLLTNNTRLVRKDFEFGGHHFDAYKVNDCLHFVEDVMRMTSGKATVYWKQSVRDLLETIYTPAAVDELLNYPHSVGKDWSMFGTKE